MVFTDRDLSQIRRKGISVETAERQLEYFRKGFPFIDLARPAVRGDGIRVIPETEKLDLAAFYDRACAGRKVIKFVPASGAATRMFKHLFEFAGRYRITEEGHREFTREKGFNSAYHFIERLRDFAFYDELDASLVKRGSSVRSLLEKKDFGFLVNALLGTSGLDYANLPKALISFHKYPGHARTSAEEHLAEGAGYCRMEGSRVAVHFTLSPEHRERFIAMMNRERPDLEAALGVTFDISLSEQKESTDTLAVDLDNRPFREADGSLHFRPAGHGALIENLNDLRGDVIFIKNIDNVVPDRLKETTILHKKVLGGLLLQLQEKISGYLEMLGSGSIETSFLDEVEAFASANLNLSFNPEHTGRMTADDRNRFLFGQLNRPLRVCGMVKNEGEPGGGPFWVHGNDGMTSLQIVESSQIGMGDPGQKKIFDGSTHFNPVDLVCGVRDYRNKPFDLHRFIDPTTGFITQKSKDGKTIKAQELPGLWNGAMAGWITVFVEVPIITFNPVKTVNDLLREQHQP
jgi:hypothetical protein